MISVLRYVLGAILGISVAVTAWIVTGSAHIIFQQLTVAGLIPTIVAGFLGGFVTGLFAPRHKVAFASIVGVALAAPLFAFLLRHGFSHGSRPILLWYFPVWLPLLFAVGGYLSRSTWVASNNSLERPR